jgi:hypothetical protein
MITSARAPESLNWRGPGLYHRGRGPEADPQHGRNLTIALRDLALVVDDLHGKDRETADRILARPSDEGSSGWEPRYNDGCGGLMEPSCPDVLRTCNRFVCIHYVTSGPHATDPDYAVAARKAAARSLNLFDQWGYRPPLRDDNRGGDNRPDVYLADLPENF